MSALSTPPLVPAVSEQGRVETAARALYDHEEDAITADIETKMGPDAVAEWHKAIGPKRLWDSLDASVQEAYRDRVRAVLAALHPQPQAEDRVVEQLREALTALLARQGYGEPQRWPSPTPLSDNEVVTILCTMGDIRKARTALASSDRTVGGGG